MIAPKNRPQQVTEEKHPTNNIEPIQERAWVLSIMDRVNDITRISDSYTMTQKMLDLMIEISQADTANFFQIDPVSDELVLSNICSEIECQHLIGLRLKRHQGLPGITFCDTEIGVVGDLPAEPDWLQIIGPPDAPRKRNVINLPVVNQEHTLGVIQIYNFQRAELDVLTVLCQRFAMELESRRNLESTRQSNLRLLTLVDMLGDVAGTLDRNQILRLVTENASKLVGAERSSVFLIDPNTREMIFQVAYQSPDPAPALRPEDTGRQKGLSKDSQKPGKHSAHFQSNEFSYFNNSTITVPLRSEVQSEDAIDSQHILGGLMVLNKQKATFQEEDAQLMQILANQASISLQVAEMYESSGDLFLGVIKALATAVDAKDPYTQGHSQRVSDYSVMIAQELGMNDQFVYDLRIGSLFHDIGKIGIPDAILLKNGKLSDQEMDIVRFHPRTGANILSQVKILEPMIPAILEHHERLDGSGYPVRLAGNQISWMGRIVAVADVFDAMTSNRPYRPGLSQQEVLSYLNVNTGRLFDASCVHALQSILERPAED